MRHFLAYGNSDQASFRTEDVRDAFDVMSVPGTIAAYYADATAAFVLSSDLDYVIDPRTPLFQEALASPRASHVSLANVMGASVRSQVGAGENSVYFAPDFYSDPVISEVVEGLVNWQRDYAGRSTGIQPKLDRYRSLLAEALGTEVEQTSPSGSRPPEFCLSPYFAVREVGDEWWTVNERVWARCAEEAQPATISPVLCVAGPGVLADALAAVPSELSDATFFWVTGFDERRANAVTLVAVRDAVAQFSDGRRLTNMYGGFYSICLEHFGLWGFNNGLAYSESRDWPALTTTGAAPARYYIRQLHLFMPPVAADALIAAEPGLECPCPVCVAPGARPSTLSYPDLKRHFALARKWEIELAESNSVDALAGHLRQSKTLGDSAASRMPARIRPDLDFLNRWASALVAD